MTLKQSVLPLQALIDSGVEDNLIALAVAQQLGCKLDNSVKLIPAIALDGKVFTHITQQTSMLTLIVSGNRHEQISLCIISSPRTPLVLGHLWLKLHKTHLDWSASVIIGWSSHCQALCYLSVIPPTSSSVTSDFFPDLSAVPPKYYDLKEVFSKS